MVVFFYCVFSKISVVAVTPKQETILKSNPECWFYDTEMNGKLVYKNTDSNCTQDITKPVDLYDDDQYCSLSKQPGNESVIQVPWRQVVMYKQGQSWEEKNYTCDSLEGQPFSCVCSCDGRDETLPRECTIEKIAPNIDPNCPKISNGVKYYNNNGNGVPQIWYGEFDQEGEVICEDNTPKICIRLTKTWEPVEQCGDKTCVSYKNSGSDTKMKSRCVDKIESPVCVDGNKVKAHNGIGYYTMNVKEYLDLEGISHPPDCSVCEDVIVNNKKTISCRGGDEVFDGCTKTDTGIDLDDGKVGTFVCDKNTQILWKCNSKPNYDIQYNCPEIHKNDPDPKKTYCGFLPNPNNPSERLNELGCITKENYDKQIEEGIQIPGSSITISTRTNDAFFCDADGGESDKDGIYTAIGCIPFTVNGLVDKLLPNIFGIGGGIAFLMMVYGFVMISTSSGDEKKMVAAKQIITSAIIGLLVSVFALFLYKLIAVNILQIPGI